jgi:hypothetical protein
MYYCTNIECRSKHLGNRYFFLVFQEVVYQLPAICNVMHSACKIKEGSVSPDDLKVANLVDVNVFVVKTNLYFNSLI